MYKPAEYTGNHQTRILIDRRAALGDLVMITPVLREMRRRHPGAFIQVVTEEPAVLNNNPHVNVVCQPTEMVKSDPLFSDPEVTHRFVDRGNDIKDPRSAHSYQKKHHE